MTRSFIAKCSGLAVAVLLLGALPGRAQTWIQWKLAAGGNNHYYALTPTATNWNAAQKLAVSWGGTLATITSFGEQDFINTNFLAGSFEHLPLWIGLCKPPKNTFSGKLGGLHLQIGVDSKTDFHWLTGEALSYTNWKSGEPSDTPPGENYVAINWEYSEVPPRGFKGDWNDTPLDGTVGYGGHTDGPYFGVVERDTDPNQPPSKLAPYLGGLAVLMVLASVVAFARFTDSRRNASRKNTKDA